ncbi:MAG: pilus assembly protein [Verrucomicrobiota bacterium]
MGKRAVIDSGPLIALFDRDDQFHQAICDFLRNYVGSLHSTVAVLTEVTHLLDFSVQAQLDFLSWVLDGGVQIHDIQTEDLNRICELTEKYSDLPMDFADATLMRIAERERISKVISIDHDFYIYRKNDRQSIDNLFQR